MVKLSDEQIIENRETAEKLLQQPFLDGGLLKQMFEQLDEFWTAPASSREDFHGAFPGGLCDHSLRVVRNLRKLAETLAPDRFLSERLDLLGLIHDLGKVGDGKRPLYVPNPNDWGRKRGFIYEINRDIPHMPISDRTIWLLQRHGVKFSAEEWLAVRLSDGQYEESNRRYAMREPDLALLLHFADRWACAEEKSL